MSAVPEVIQRSQQAWLAAEHEPILSEKALVARRNLVVNVMAAMMKDKVHYGKIPGTPKPTLYKPGAELLFSMFRVSTEPDRIEDLSTHDEVRYRVTVRAVSQSGAFLGAASGECSSSEEKYRWRRPVCNEEFDETPEDRRREVWKRGDNGTFKQKQVRTNPPDVAHTILAMATKRASIALCRNVTACSDIFTSGLEDLPPEYVDSIVEDEASAAATHIERPRRKEEAQEANGPADSADHRPAGIYVKAVREITSGTSKSGPWTLWGVTLSDGVEHKTFSKTVRDTAANAAAGKLPVSYELEDGPKGPTMVMLEVLR